MSQPQLWVFAGPNGSGKSTVTSKVIDNTPGVYIYADMIQKELDCSAKDAAIIADFTFETVLSTERNLDLMQQAKEQGYEITCIYVLTNDPDINVVRVRKRARMGGHDVPQEKVKSRYIRCMGLFPRLLSICSRLLVFDNSGDQDSGTADEIVYAEDGKIVEIKPNAMWSESDIQELLEGNYGDRFK